MKNIITGVIVSILLYYSAPAYSDSILPGSDYFETVSSSFDFSSNPIAAGFFDPGSEPFDGTVIFRGNPLGGVLGPTDTIIRRNAGIDFPPPVTVPIEIVALNLVSVNPITVTYSNGSHEAWDVRLSLVNSNGSMMNITHSQPDGGTFSSVLNVSPQLIFTQSSIIGGAGKDLLRTDILRNFSSTWSHTSPDGALPGPNNFFPGGLPGDASTLNHIIFDGNEFDTELVLTTVPPSTNVPEPATIYLLAGCCVILIFFRRKLQINS